MSDPSQISGGAGLMAFVGTVGILMGFSGFLDIWEQFSWLYAMRAFFGVVMVLSFLSTLILLFEEMAMKMKIWVWAGVGVFVLSATIFAGLFY